MPKRTLLAFHIAARQAERRGGRGCRGFRPVADGDACDEQHAHDREDGPALALVADHAAEHIGQRGADREDRTIWTKLDSAVGFSKGWAALALKKPPPLVPSNLMAICEATGPTRDGLLRTFERGCFDRRSPRSAGRLAIRGTA
jgi:hypothetical protein